MCIQLDNLIAPTDICHTWLCRRHHDPVKPSRLPWETGFRPALPVCPPAHASAHAITDTRGHPLPAVSRSQAHSSCVWNQDSAGCDRDCKACQPTNEGLYTIHVYTCTCIYMYMYFGVFSTVPFRRVGPKLNRL